MRAIIVAAALLGLLLVAAGAAGAHSIPIEATRQWDSALLYGFAHTLAAILAVCMPFRSTLKIISGWFFIASVVLFGGIQIGKIMLAGIPSHPTPLDELSFLVPVGGICFIVGWLLLGLTAAFAPRSAAGEDVES